MREHEQIKRLVVCCDGTWQSTDNVYPTNVLKLAQAVKPVAKDKEGNEIAQVLYYDEGVGTSQGIEEGDGIQQAVGSVKDVIDRVGGGAFGWWISNKIKEAYIFLCLNYTPGDEIYLFGFSRGAYTVRSLAGLINCSGLLERPDISKSSQAYKIYRIEDEDEREKAAEKFRQEHQQKPVPIKLLGCWDTVGALGIPDFIPWISVDNILNQKYEFHNTKLSPIIQNALHAIAVDERRKAFDVTHMLPGQGFQGKIQNMWFPGDHTCIGGGAEETRELSNAALQWMVDEASQLGLECDLSLSQDSVVINHKAPFKNKSAIGEFGMNDRDIVGFNFDDLHTSLKQRWCDLQQYRPNNLQKFFQQLNAACRE